MHIIKILKRSNQTQQKFSEKYAGKLPVELADELQVFCIS